MLRRSIRVSAFVAAIGLGHAVRAWADGTPSTSAAAEALFQEGRALLMAGKVDEACPKLEESQRLDPATGTLMAVALCHEQQGKLASAWAAFADIEGRSRLDGRADRERTAREHGAALRPRLSTLTLDVAKEAADVGGFSISVDGVAIGRGAWDVAIPVDGGTHVVAAAAAGRTSWRTSVSIRREGDHARVAVPLPPVLVELGPARAESSDPSRRLDEDRATTAGAPPEAHTQRIVGQVLLGIGVLGLGTSVVVALDAKHDYDAAVANCRDGMCQSGPLERARHAQAQGDVASLIAIAAGVATAAGAALWLWAPRGSKGSASTATGARVSLGPSGLALSGRF